jgi:peptide subunit release factor 1 (eRF1)
MNNLLDTLRELSAQPATRQPYLSIYLNWSTDSSGQRPALRVLEQELDRIAATLRQSGTGMESFTIDRERVMSYVNTEAPKEARGLAIFACHAESIWVTAPLQVPVETEVAVDRFPHTFNLARLIDNYETYAVAVADSQESQIFLVALDSAWKVGETDAGEEIRRFDAGGSSAHMVFQHRTEKVIRDHTRQIGERLERIIRRYDVRHVVIVGNDSIKGAVMSTLPEQVKQRLVDYMKFDTSAGGMPALMQAIEPLMREVERSQEANDVAQLEEQLATKGGLAVAGVADTAEALSKGQVRTLLLQQDFGGQGGECPSCGWLRPGQRANCPYDGTPLQPVELREAFSAKALQQSANVQVVEQSGLLDRHEGVGALLWYRDDEQARTIGDNIA